MTMAGPTVRLTTGVLLALTLMRAAPAAATSPDPVRTPEAAVQQVVAAGGAVYAGDCASTRAPDDIGHVCATFIAERAGLQAYLVGRTFAEFSGWVFVARQGGGWQVAGTAPLDFFDTSGRIPWPR